MPETLEPPRTVESFSTDLDPDVRRAAMGGHVRSVAMQAYLSGVPAFLHMRQLTEFVQGRRFFAPNECELGGWVLMRQLADPTTTTVSPNVDTLYGATYVLLDRQGPVVVTVPPIADRYFSVAMLDAWFDNFHVIGTRSGDTAGAHVLLTPPGWHGEAPDGITRVVEAPTASVCMIQRIYTRDASEYAHLHGLQDAIVVAPLDGWTRGDARFPPIDLRDFEIDRMRETRDPIEFFRFVNRYTAENPPPGDDARLGALFATVGLGPSDEVPDDADVVAAISAGAHDAQAAIDAVLSAQESRGAWRIPEPGAGHRGPDLLRNAAVQLTQMGLLPLEEAAYFFAYVDDEGTPLDSARDHEVRFAPGALPPCSPLGFWSVTLYDQRSLLAANEIDRHLIRPDTPGLTHDADGGLTIRVAARRPHDVPLGNWLPAPTGAFILALRVYLADDDVITGTWAPPTVTARA
jgi:hypothetical protein